MTKLDAGLMTSLPAPDPASASVWGSKRINPRPQSCLCLTWSGYPSNDEEEEEPTATKHALMTTTKRKCFFCGRAYHERKHCPVINSTCFFCGKIGHFSRVCRSNNGSGKRLKCIHQSAALSLVSLTSMACPGNLLRSAIIVNLNGKNLIALVDFGSSESCINSKVSKDLKVKVYPSRSQTQMASSAMKMKSNGFCLVDLELKCNK